MYAISPEKSLFSDKKASFLLAASVTYTGGIAGITQAGIPGKIFLTPTLDAEFISTGRVFSLDDLAETASGIPTPGLLTRAAHRLAPFASVEILDLGLSIRPKECVLYDFGIGPSPSIADGIAFDAKRVFEKGRTFGRIYEPDGEYVIMGESTPGGTTTAQAAIAALGLETDGLFASSFKDAPVEIKEVTIAKALSMLDDEMSVYERLGHTADNTLMFVAGFVLEASQRFEVVLGGGTQMAAAILIADRLASLESIPYDMRQISLCTTRWIAQDDDSSVESLLDGLRPSPKAAFADFLYEDALIPVLKAYDEGEAKEGVGAGAAIAYAYSHGVTQKEITAEVERSMMEMG